MNSAATEDPQAFIFSANGSWPVGIILGLFFAALKWAEKNKQKLDKPERRTVRIWPHDRVGEITIIALIFGLIGAKLFNAFEVWDAFIKDPASYIFSAEGLTFYGGLICAALAIWWYAKRHKIGFWHLNDAAAPALMISYSIGRIGCQVSGDGDWGIASTHPKPFGWLPDWMWGFTFPHNVAREGDPIPGCVDKFCTELPHAVYPTPFYETIMCLVLFIIIWSFRKKFKVPGTLFGFYLMLNGLERFFIEKIRVNTTISLFGFHPTQAEVISTLLFISGLLIWVILSKRDAAKKSTISS